MTFIDLSADLAPCAHPHSAAPVPQSLPEVLDLEDLHQVVGGDGEFGELPKNGW